MDLITRIIVRVKCGSLKYTEDDDILGALITQCRGTDQPPYGSI